MKSDAVRTPVKCAPQRSLFRALGMTEDEHRSKVYEILEKKHGRKVNFEMNEQGNYDCFIEDCYKEGINPEYVADGIVNSEKKASEGK